MGSVMIMISRPKMYCAALAACMVGFATTPLLAQNTAPRTAQGGVVPARINCGGTIGGIACFDKDAEVLAVGSDGGVRIPVAVRAPFGTGRVVALAHTAFLSADGLGMLDTGAFIEQQIEWAGGRAKGARRIGASPDSLAQALAARGLNAHPLAKEWHTALNGFDVVCFSGGDLNEVQRGALSRFIAAGNGLVTAQTGWGWQQGAKKHMKQNGFNVVMAPAGLAFTDATVDRISGGFDVVTEPAMLLNAAHALVTLEEHEAGKIKLDPDGLAQAGATLTAAADVLPDKSLLTQRLSVLTTERADTIVPSPNKPLRRANALDRSLLAWQLGQILDAPAERVKAHPAAEEFPGSVPKGTPTVSRVVEINTATPGRHSFGLYAAPGAIVTVAIRKMDNKAIANAGLSIRIGAHSDRLFHTATWRRAPEITNTTRISTVTTRAANPFGGIVYIECPDLSGEPRSKDAPVIEATISGAVEAPFFVLGKTDPKKWMETIRAAPGPWAELATDKVILTVPRAVVLDLDYPATLLEFWNQVLDGAADLAGIPHERVRPERYVADIDISAGYMHAGYPIMTHLDATADMVNHTKMNEAPWGLFHELGHNHQDSMWTFDGTGEVTVNLFSLYLCETLCRRTVDTSWGGAIAKARGELADRRRTGVSLWAYGEGPKELNDTTGGKVDLALRFLMYVQVREAFGWDPIKATIAEYRTLAPEDRPKTEAQKRDQWMTRLSKHTGKNLGPFFEAWGLPTTAEARNSLIDLPVWMPDALTK